MKRFSLLSLLICLVVFTGFTPVLADKPATLIVSYSFKNIVEGYDHDSKTEVYIDGSLAATSTVKKESEQNSVSCTTTRGQHSIRILNYALYEGEWQEHTISNDYSIDCKYEENITINKKKYKIALVFDIDKGTTRVK